MIYYFIKENKPKGLSFKRACQELKVSSSGYFKYLKRQEDIKAERQGEDKISQAFEYHNGFYGYRKLFHYFVRKGDFSFSLSQVRLILKKQGLRSKTKSGVS